MVEYRVKEFSKYPSKENTRLILEVVPDYGPLELALYVVTKTWAPSGVLELNYACCDGPGAGGKDFRLDSFILKGATVNHRVNFVGNKPRRLEIYEHEAKISDEPVNIDYLRYHPGFNLLVKLLPESEEIRPLLKKLL